MPPCKKMIKYELRVGASLLAVLLPYLAKVFRDSLKGNDGERFVLPDSGDEDLDLAWREGLIEEGRADRLSLSRLLQRPGLELGRVEIPEDEADEALRGMTELRLHLREKGLESVNDEDLENGRIEIQELTPEARTAYLGYLLLAEMQERLIAEIL